MRYNSPGGRSGTSNARGSRFWVEAEDHDWAEVRSTAFLDGNSSLNTRPRLTLRVPASKRSQRFSSLRTIRR